MDAGGPQGLTSLRRAAEFQHAYEDALATQVRRLRGVGRALLHPGLPLVWDLNFVRLEVLDGSVAAAALARSSERVLAGYGHRKINVDDEAEGTRLAPVFEALGWHSDRSLVMVHRGQLPAERPAYPAEEIAWRPFGRSVEAFSRELGRPADVGRQLAERHRLTAEVVPTRWFGAYVGARLGASCELYSDGRTAQIETVVTLRGFRGRGLATAVVVAALEAARDHDFVFLVADAADWPQEWYRRLGFEPAGILYRFIRFRES